MIKRDPKKPLTLPLFDTPGATMESIINGGKRLGEAGATIDDAVEGFKKLAEGVAAGGGELAPVKIAGLDVMLEKSVAMKVAVKSITVRLSGPDASRPGLQSTITVEGANEWEAEAIASAVSDAQRKREASEAKAKAAYEVRANLEKAGLPIIAKKLFPEALDDAEAAAYRRQQNATSDIKARVQRNAGKEEKPDISSAFLAYHQRNPQVYRAFEKLVLDAIAGAEARGRAITRMGAQMVVERLRWETLVTGDDAYKINNNYGPYYARLFMSRHAKHAELFRTRGSEADDMDFSSLSV